MIFLAVPLPMGKVCTPAKWSMDLARAELISTVVTIKRLGVFLLTAPQDGMLVHGYSFRPSDEERHCLSKDIISCQHNTMFLQDHDLVYMYLIQRLPHVKTMTMVYMF